MEKKVTYNLYRYIPGYFLSPPLIHGEWWLVQEFASYDEAVDYGNKNPDWTHKITRVTVTEEGV